MRLEAGKIYLRPLTKREVPEVYEAIEASRRELHNWMFWETETDCEYDVLKYVRRTQFQRRKGISADLGVFDAATNRFLGCVGLYGIDARHQVAELGYWVRSDRHRRGVAFAASVALLRLGFEDMKLHKVRARVNVANRASAGLLKKLGFVKEGISRDDLKVAGKWSDHVYLGLLEREYRGLSKSFDRQVPRTIAP